MREGMPTTSGSTSKWEEEARLSSGGSEALEMRPSCPSPPSGWSREMTLSIASSGEIRFLSFADGCEDNGGLIPWGVEKAGRIVAGDLVGGIRFGAPPLTLGAHEGSSLLVLEW